MMYPILRRFTDGEYGIYWRGILVDWEFAKLVGEGPDTIVQPFRNLVCILVFV